MRESLASFLLALQFLTRLPITSKQLYTPERMANTVAFFPLAGAVVGGLLALLFSISMLALPVPAAERMANTVAFFPLAGAVIGSLLALLFSISMLALSACLILVASPLVTGAFHEDGLADTFDGLGATGGREETLRVMRDSRLGSFGALALIGSFALRLALLASLPAATICGALVTAHGVSRLSAVLVIATGQYQRAEGTGKPVAEGISRGSLRIALVTGVLLIIGWLVVLPISTLVLAVAGTVAGHLWLRRLADQRIGGYTGDTLGAVQQVSEIGFYLGCAVGHGLLA